MDGISNRKVNKNPAQMARDEVVFLSIICRLSVKIED